MTSDNWFFYILRCRDSSLYSGITKDLDERLKKHNRGKGAKYTASHLPVMLAYSEFCASEADAKKREAEVKSWPKAKKEQLVAKRV